MDLHNEAKVPFQSMDRESQVGVITGWLDGDVIEFLDGDRWSATNMLMFARPMNSLYREGNPVLRVRPAPKTKPSIDWSHVAAKYRWLAMDSDGESFLSERQPAAKSASWVNGGTSTPANDFASYVPGDCDWRNSLVERPEGV